MKKYGSCYLCDAPGTSREHAPPRCLFPEAKDLPPRVSFRETLIKVDSCDEHNSKKSKDDEYLMWILSTASRGNAHRQAHFQSKGMRTYRRRPETFLRLLENLTPVLLPSVDGTLRETALFEVDLSRFNKCMWHTATALFFHQTGNKWSGECRVFTDAFVHLKGPDAEAMNKTLFEGTQRIAKALKDVPAQGENPEIFTYKVFSGQASQHAVHIVFYEDIQVAVLLGDA